MVDTVANRQEVCEEAWCVTPNVVSYEYCIGVSMGFSLYGINADDMVLTVKPCPSDGGWTRCLPTDNVIVWVVCVLCGVCARCLCGPCRGMATTVSVVEMFCFFDAGKILKVFPETIENSC